MQIFQFACFLFAVSTRALTLCVCSIWKLEKFLYTQIVDMCMYMYIYLLRIRRVWPFTSRGRHLQTESK